MTIRTKAVQPYVIKAALKTKGRFETTHRGVKVVIETRHGKYEITRTEGNEKPDFWVYRRERIALDRFNELIVSLSRRRF